MNCPHRFVPVAVRVWSLALVVAGIIAHAQFKVVGPAPVSPAVARQQIRTLLEKVDPSNRQQTIQTLSGLLAWYRDILDEELIAAWKKDPRANLTDVTESLADSRVASVSYAGFPDNPYYPLVQKYLGGRACSLLTFRIRGDAHAGSRFYDALRLFKRLVNLGDAKSLVSHSASTTHRQLSPDELKAVCIEPETIRLSVGIEHIDDLLEDLDQALDRAVS